jgi:hypothetical protein
VKGVADDKSRRPAAAAVAAQEGIDPALSSGSFDRRKIRRMLLCFFSPLSASASDTAPSNAAEEGEEGEGGGGAVLEGEAGEGGEEEEKEGAVLEGEEAEEEAILLFLLILFLLIPLLRSCWRKQC